LYQSESVPDPIEEETPDTVIPDKNILTNLGPQITEAVIQSGQFLTTDKGVEMLYSVGSGAPARLIGLDVSNGRLLVNLELRDTESCWSLALATDGWLHAAGGAQGTLLTHGPRSQVVDDPG